MITKKSLVGTWKLISCELRSNSDQVYYPYGEYPIGRIIYHDNDYVSAFFGLDNRPNFSSNDVMSGTIEEKSTAMETFVSWCGKFEIQGNTVYHHIEMSLFPNWVGISQERFYVLDENRLTISTAPFLIDGQEQEAHMIWEKI